MTPCSICGKPTAIGTAHPCCAAWGVSPCPACQQSVANLREWTSRATGRHKSEADMLAARAPSTQEEADELDDRRRRNDALAGAIREAQAHLAGWVAA